ncbi:MAG: hypothetical protein H7X79_10660 [Sporomusaceae bacterium]|nr:hypothetical protein [Sporomusaceae bacterium]
MVSNIQGEPNIAPKDIKAYTHHTPKSSIHISSTLKGVTPDGRYIHIIKNGKVTYHPGYYTIDGRLLQPHS